MYEYKNVYVIGPESMNPDHNAKEIGSGMAVKALMQPSF